MISLENNLNFIYSLEDTIFIFYKTNTQDLSGYKNYCKPLTIALISSKGLFVLIKFKEW